MPQKRMKSRKVNVNGGIGVTLKVIPVKLYLDVVPSASPLKICFPCELHGDVSVQD